MESNLPNMETLKPMRSDVMLVHIPRNTESSIIDVKENPDDHDVQKFRIVAVGKDVKFVKPDEIALVSWTRITPQQKALDKNGDVVKIGFTDEKELLAIIDEE
tara:strand:+ start:422 stop:730 length:309 start_codon:yes stop_codon:yes gene_type:complete